MTTDSDSHVPFTHLPVEDKVLFFFYCMAGRRYYRPRHPSTEEIRAHLEAVWNTLKLTLDDLSDHIRIEELLKPYFAKRASSESSFHVPAAVHRGKRRQ